MMTWQELIAAFEKERLKQAQLVRIAERLEKREISYEEASLYAQALGDVLGRLYGENDMFPEGTGAHEALTVLSPTLSRAYRLASIPAMAAQEIQNRKYGVPLKAWRPTIKPGRIEGLAAEIAQRGYDEAIITPQVVNLTQSAVDDTMSVNAYNLAKEGYETIYVRKTHGSKVCGYCAALAGEHTAKDAPQGFFGHHLNCNCTVEVSGIAKKGRGYGKSFNKAENAGKIRAEAEEKREQAILVPKSVGASGRKYSVSLPDGRHAKIAAGTKIIKIKAFAGKGTQTPIRIASKLEELYGIKASEWMKVRGEGIIRDEGKNIRVELHWYEAEGKRVSMKVKRYFDES